MNIKKLFSIFYLLLVLFIAKNLDSPNLWLDESGQFWMSKGLNHYSAPEQLPKGISDVIHENQNFNLDPGGFTLLLHFWSEFSGAHIWLRLLPFLFFLLTLYLFYQVAYRWTNQKTWAVFMSAIPLFSPIILQYAFEVRAYSMEYMGTAFLVLFLEKIRQNESYLSALVFGSIMAILLSSRYSMAIPMMVACCLFLISTITKRIPVIKKFFLLAICAAPILVSAALIYFFTLSHQNPSATPPSYLNAITLKYGVGYIFKIRFLAPAFICLLFITAYIYSVYKYKQIAVKFQAFFWFLIATNFVFILLSAFGYYAYDFTSRWSISLHTLALFSVVALLSLIRLVLQEQQPVWINGKIPVVFAGFFAVALALCYLIPNGIFKYREYDHIGHTLKNMPLEKYNHVLVNRNESSTFRYLFEYGALKKQAHNFYPDKITISSQNDIEDMKTVEDRYDLVILSHEPKLSVDTLVWHKVDNRSYVWERVK